VALFEKQNIKKTAWWHKKKFTKITRSDRLHEKIRNKIYKNTNNSTKTKVTAHCGNQNAKKN